MPADAPSFPTQPDRPARIEGLDVARGVALVAMATYHFTWDLEFFGYVQPGMTAVGGWKLFARCIASSFLVLVGISLVLAHGESIRWPGFLRRLAMVAGAAAAISVVTYIAVPQGFIFFGILHQIALASLLGLAFLSLPWPLTAIVAALVVAAPYFARAAVFDHPFLWWVGLSPVNPRSNDYVPLFPWFGAVLAGIALAKLAESSGLAQAAARLHPWRWTRLLAVGGRHSLAFYLVHQPLLIGAVWLFAQAHPAPQTTPEVGFRDACEQSCETTRDTPFCARYCVCMLDTLARQSLLDSVMAGDGSTELRDSVNDSALECTQSTEDAAGRETHP